MYKLFRIFVWLNQFLFFSVKSLVFDSERLLTHHIKLLFFYSTLRLLALTLLCAIIWNLPWFKLGDEDLT